MLRELLTGSSLLSLPVLSMLGFMALFVGVCLWVFAGKRKERYEAVSRLPLEDLEDDVNPREVIR